MNKLLKIFVVLLITVTFLTAAVAVAFPVNMASASPSPANPLIIKVASAQTDPKILDKTANLNKILQMIDTAAKEGAKLIVFTECALTGYIFNSLDEAKPVAETVPGPSTEKLIAKCKELKVYVVVGLIEVDKDKYYNCAVLVGPEGLVGKYRKTHLPFLGVDKFVNPGDLGLNVFKTEIGNIGVLICYDSFFHEPIRVLALKGADIIALPTNWSVVVSWWPKYLIPAHAIQNRVYMVTCNRAGEERGDVWLGHSQIVDGMASAILAETSDKEEIIYATIDVLKARDKKRPTGDIFEKRRPELYDLICEPTITNLKKTISDLTKTSEGLKTDIASWQSTASTNLYGGLVGGLIIGLIVGIAGCWYYYRGKQKAVMPTK